MEVKLRAIPKLFSVNGHGLLHVSAEKSIVTFDDYALPRLTLLERW